MQVRISETYDLSTQVGKMGLVAIHTPSYDKVARLWGGLCKNFKFLKFTSCDVTMACASMLPADPLQIGTEAGDIAPQDMFNPILYKAVSNDSYSNFVNRIMCSVTGVYGATGGSVSANNNPDFGNGTDGQPLDQFSLYYSLLADKDGWRKSMPQSGLQMKGLYPVVFSVLNTIGDNAVANSQSISGMSSEFNKVHSRISTGDTNKSIGTFMRGPPIRMPRVPTAVLSASGGNDPEGVLTLEYNTPTYPVCYVGAIVLPPAKLNKLYYRMRVTWTVEFTEPRSLFELASFQSLEDMGTQFYGTDYATQSKVATNTTSMVDTKDADVQLIMEGA